MTGTGIDIDYKELVLELIDLVRFGKASRAMLELRTTLFVAACSSFNRDQCLLPFPYCFFDGKTKNKDFTGLHHHIGLIPALDKIDGKTELPALTWALIYWVLTNPLTISPLFEHDYSALWNPIINISNDIERKTGLGLLEAIGKNLFAFEVTSPSPKPAFVEGKAKYGSYFAFHGSPLCNFHSIVHRGLLSALNKRSAYGFGSYLSSDLKMAREYSSRLGGSGWSQGAFGIVLTCVAICEIVDAPTGLTKHKLPLSRGLSFVSISNNKDVSESERYATVTVVANDDLVQLAYVLLFAPSPRLPTHCLQKENTKKTAHCCVCGEAGSESAPPSSH